MVTTKENGKQWTCEKVKPLTDTQDCCETNWLHVHKVTHVHKLGDVCLVRDAFLETKGVFS